MRSVSTRREDRIGFWLVALTSCVTFVALATAGRLPGVDLPQHALYLSRMLQGDTDIYQVRWVVPYSLLFAIALPVAKLTDPVRAMWIATAFAMALVPVGSAMLARALRRSPALGLFAYLTVFSSVAAWGFSSLVLSTGVFAMAVAAAIRYARAPSLPRGLWLALALLATYSAHLMSWVMALAACWTIVALWPRRPALVLTWPPLLGSVASSLLLNATLAGMVQPWMKGVQAAMHGDEDHPLAARIAMLPVSVAELGRPRALLPYWVPLALVLVVGLALSLRELARAHARLRRLGPRVRHLSGWPRGRALLRRRGVLLAWLACIVGYFVVPNWVGETAMVYQRLLAFAGVLTPALFVGRRHASSHRVALVAVLPVLALVAGVRGEVLLNAERTRCLDELAAKMRPGESLLSLYYGSTSPNPRIPLDLHSGPELIARRGGLLAEDFTDYGIGPVTYQPGYDRIVVPPSVFHAPKLYRHAQHGRELTAWLFVRASPDTPALARKMLGSDPALRIEQCGAWTLVTDTSVPPGSRSREVFLPHYHPEGQCSLEAHPGAFAR